jgi:hypothetical protein
VTIAATAAAIQSERRMMGPEACSSVSPSRAGAGDVGSDATVEDELTVGMAVPDTVVLLDVPNYKATMVNGKRVFIDPSNRTIIEIVE